ncbi:hypothetical protein [Herbaspirillum huttiense]|uniref:N-acetyltransferase domain-containing protein n=1 Tax=Herbaspirillum huttiense subsp. lycopersici TaxID=3074428 RepID=A0ABU2EGN9_9BURK|nr:hypothetical protein [Herbaspirillum huttiense]MDR9847032.1 hypothetical protein [Herbaspirillum huttiense SE1]
MSAAGDLIIERRPRPAKHSLSLLSRIYVERGTKADWDLLHELHYKAERLGIGPKIFRCMLDGQVIGVGVMTVPKMLLSGRNEAMPHMRPNTNGRDSKLINRHRALWLNAHSCTNSRLVLDTMYRGAGIAYRMQNLMMRMTGCKIVEFQSSMSKFNPFAAKAGMRFTRPRRSAHYEKGLAFFRRWFVSEPMDYVGIKGELDSMAPGVRTRCVAEMRKFYYTCSSMEKSGDNRANGTSRVEAMEVGYLLKSLQQLVLASPLYGIYSNPDFGRQLPPRLPLTAFDHQAVTQPLALDLAIESMAQIDAPEINLNTEEADAPDSQAD